MRRRYRTWLISAAAVLIPAAAELSAQRLVLFSGNGQVVLEQFPATLPLTVRAEDPAGRPLAGVAVQWEQIPLIGSLRNTELMTDANGFAATNFVASSVVPGNSFTQGTIRATSPLGSADFVITISMTRTPAGSLAPPPLPELLLPPIESRILQGPPGGVLRGAVSLRVVAQSGAQIGQPVPNVGIRLVHDSDPTLPAAASCIGPGGLVLSDSQGIATCDVLLARTPGVYGIRVAVGEYSLTPVVEVRISGSAACAYTLTPSSAQYAAAGGQGSFQVATSTGCAIVATTGVAWITVTQTGAGGVVNYSVAANAGATRTGTISVGADKFTVTQAGAQSPALLTILTSTGLPRARVGQQYGVTLSASGGSLPYVWSATAALPPWLSLNAATGELRGTPPAAATINIPVQVVDSLGARAANTFTLIVDAAAATGLAIGNAGFPNAVVGTAYRERLTVVGRCATIFPRPTTFALLSGALPNGLGLGQDSTGVYEIAGVPSANGTFLFTLQVTDPCGFTATGQFTIVVGPPGGVPGPSPGPAPGPQGNLAVSPPSVSIRLVQGSSGLSTTQTLSVTSSGGVLAYTVTLSAQSAPWLTILGPLSGATPGSLIVGATNASLLALGTYQGAITITVPATGQSIAVPVSLSVAPQPRLTATPQQVSLRTVSGAGPFSRAQAVVQVSNDSGPGPFTAFPSVAWIRTPSSGSTPASMVIEVDTSGMSAGTYIGNVTILAEGTAPVTVPVTVIVGAPPPIAVSATRAQFVVRQGEAPPGPQQITVTGGIAGDAFTVTAGTLHGGAWLFATPASGMAPATITLQVNPVGLGPGDYQGSVRIAAGVSGEVVIQVELTIARPAPVLAAIVNAASFLGGPVAAGEIVTLFGALIGPDQATGPRMTTPGFLDTSVADVRVLFDGVPAPLLYVSARQVTAIAPFGIAGRFRTRVELEYRGVRSNGVELAVVEAAPGIFALPDGAAAAVNEDGAINSDSDGAEPGTIVSLYLTGGGTMSFALADGEIVGATLPQLTLEVAVEIDGLPAEVIYAGGAPQLPAGAVQINARVPQGAASGAVSLRVRIGSASSQAGVTLRVK
jgi:uncharacterized protein (TIGR03437 family)